MCISQIKADAEEAKASYKAQISECQELRGSGEQRLEDENRETSHRLQHEIKVRMETEKKLSRVEEELSAARTREKELRHEVQEADRVRIREVEGARRAGDGV